MATKEQNAALAEFAPYALECERKWDMPAEATCAQWIAESRYGEKKTGKNNVFGMKRAARHKAGEWCRTTEVYQKKRDFDLAVSSGSIRNSRIISNGPPIHVSCDAEFASFESITAACDDRAMLISTAPVYADSWKIWKETRDVQKFVKALASHYATSGGYASLLAHIAGQSNVFNALAKAEASKLA